MVPVGQSSLKRPLPYLCRQARGRPLCPLCRSASGKACRSETCLQTLEAGLIPELVQAGALVVLIMCGAGSSNGLQHPAPRTSNLSTHSRQIATSMVLFRSDGELVKAQAHANQTMILAHRRAWCEDSLPRMLGAATSQGLLLTAMASFATSLV